MKSSKLNTNLWSIISMLLWSISTLSYAQEKTENKIIMQIQERINNKYPNIINTIVKIKNNDDIPFNGSLLIKEVKGINAIFDSQKDIELSSNDSIFVPVRFIVQPTAQAGKQTVIYKLSDSEKNVKDERHITIVVPEKESLLFYSESPNIFITNPNDSIRIKTFIENKGNKDEDVNIICIIPGTANSQIFPEKKIKIHASEKREIDLNFILPYDQRNVQQFQVNIYASKGKDKRTFANLSTMVWNVSSNQNYQGNNMMSLYDSYFSYSQNSLAVSFRQMGNDNYMTEVRGSGSVDLPAGYLDFKGNIYKMSMQNEYYMTNTSLAYRLDGNELLLGNLSENFETNLFGRGAKLTITNSDQSKKLSAGVIDNNFNILAKEKSFSNGYSSFITYQTGIRNVYRGTSTSIIYQKDNFEEAENYMLSNQLRYSINNNWLFTLKTHGAISQYEIVNEKKLSAASELRYRGTIDDFNLSGNFFISSNYFPGSRKGLVSLSQSFEKSLENKAMLRATVLYYKSTPRSYNYNITSYNNNLKTDVGIILPKLGNFTPSFSYQFQTEKANGYGSYFNTLNSEISSMHANRLIEQVNWTSSDLKHFVLASIENGLVKYPYSNKLDFQFRGSSSYTNKYLIVNAIYQSGSYHIAEYALAKDRGKRFYRFILSSSINKSFANEKYVLSFGQNIVHDYISKFTPSVFSNFTYKSSPKTTFYLNSSWYRYQFSGTVNNIFNIEAGFSVKFNGHKPSSRKKSKIVATLFYDNNGNNIFDQGDELANNYNLVIDKRPFVSDEKGKISYNNVPYGKYKIQPTSQNGWFYYGDTIDVEKFKTNVDIPLQQTGTINGKIDFIVDSRKSQETDLNKSGFKFILKNSDDKTVAQTVVTDHNGQFMLFLPPGDYTIEMNLNTLSKEMEAVDSSFKFSVHAMKITTLPTFRIRIKNKAINIKKFEQ